MPEDKHALSKNQRRKLKKRAGGGPSAGTSKELILDAIRRAGAGGAAEDDASGVDVEYVSAEYAGEEEEDEAMREFRDVFSKFAKPEDLTNRALAVPERPVESPLPVASGSAEDASPRPVSKKKKKLASRLSVAELKQLVTRPDVVEAHDATSSDPRLLVYLKAYRNTVPVPRHWCHKRKYLQGKRGIEKPPFALPEYIADTGIAKIRESVLESEANKKGRQKTRDRMTPKMGRIDIDFQVLHDAFFRYQTKPKLTLHGDLYYEGKEFEVDLREKKAGILSEELKVALGMSSETTPPPWLVNMQRYGPPPSYPTLRIPGVNAPIPAGASYGFHGGGWGKPPVDEFGHPLYGDVYGAFVEREAVEEAVDKSYRWGVVAAAEDNEEEEEEQEQQEEEEEGFARGTETPATAEGIGSVASGLETPDTIDLRKRTGAETPDSQAPPRELYQVIPQRRADAQGQLFGSDHAYVMPVLGGVAAEGEEPDVGAGVGDKRKKSAKGEATSNAAKKMKDFKF